MSLGFSIEQTEMEALNIIYPRIVSLLSECVSHSRGLFSVKAGSRTLGSEMRRNALLRAFFTETGNMLLLYVEEGRVFASEEIKTLVWCWLRAPGGA